MDEKDLCEGCNQEDRCQEVYRKLGKTQGPSVVLKVLLAFLLPIAVFIAALAAFARILGKVGNKEMRTALSFVLAAAVTFVCIFITRVINKRIYKQQK